MPASLRLSRQTRALIAALGERPLAWQHGYDLMRRTALKSGTLYPVLMRLSDHELVEAQWQDPVPPARAPRHAYRLTAAGRQLAVKLGEPETLRFSRPAKGLPA